MTDYQLHFDHLDGDRRLAPRAVSVDTTEALAGAVYRHARGILNSGRITVELDHGDLSGAVARHGTPIGEFTLTAVTDQAPAERVPMHGYTAADLHDITTAVLRIDRWHNADTTDRYDAIWHELAEHLCLTDTAPTRHGLISLGLRASNTHVRVDMHHHGNAFGASGAAPMPGFARYWFTSYVPSPERRVVERIAVDQVLPLLTKRQRQAIEALAIHGDYGRAAEAIGSNPRTFASIIAGARRRFYRWWHQGETPPTNAWRKTRAVIRPTDTTGKPRLTQSQVDALRARYEAGQTLGQVAADAGVPLSTLSALMRGTRRPAEDPPAVRA